MNKLFDFIPPAAYPVISEYAKILIPALITYLVTRYSLKNPHKYEIKKKQFETVYLPLYLLTQQYIVGSHRDVLLNLQTYVKKVDKLIYKNYPYVYPKTLRLFNDLKLEMTKPKINMYFIANFEYQTTADYIRLKKSLHYPCDSAISFFKQLNRFDKGILFVNMIIFLILIFTIATLVISLSNGKFLETFEYLFIILIHAFLLYLLHNIKKH